MASRDPDFRVFSVEGLRAFGGAGCAGLGFFGRTCTVPCLRLTQAPGSFEVKGRQDIRARFKSRVLRV